MTKLERIIGHWAASTYAMATESAEHYHFSIDGNGAVIPGKFKPEDNLNVADGKYAQHTYHCNTGSIGVSILAMAGAVESPFNPGRWPIKLIQQDAYVKLVAQLAKKYAIPITPQTILTHAEVQPTLGIRQKQKWDITWLPGMKRPGKAVEVGDMLRRLIKVEYDKLE